ncbi:MAG TPA: DNA repair protein RecO [Capsulimonadaceae bacterium]
MKCVWVMALAFKKIDGLYPMAQYNTMGIVLRRMAFGETDNILTIYTRDRGRVSAIAKGARKAGSRLTGASEVLTCANFGLATGKSLHVLQQAEVKNSFPALRKDLMRLAHGQYMAELLSHFVAEDDPQPDLFTLLRSTLLLLERIADPEMASRWFELRLMERIGYAPDLETCAVCGEPVPGPSTDAADRFALSAAQGGVLCPYHARPREIDDHSELSYDAVDFVQHVNAHDLEHIRAVLSVAPPSHATATQARLALRRYIRYRCDSDLRSIAFMDSLG